MRTNGGKNEATTLIYIAGSQFTHQPQHRSTKNADNSIWVLNCRRELIKQHAYGNFLSVKGHKERKYP